MEDQHFWDDAKESAKVIKEVKGLKDTIEAFSKLESLYEDVETLIEMGYEEEDESILEEVKESFTQLEKQLDDMTVSTLLSDEYDIQDPDLSIAQGHFASSTYTIKTTFYERNGKSDPYAVQVFAGDLRDDKATFEYTIQPQTNEQTTDDKEHDDR